MKEVIKHGNPDYIKAKDYKVECDNCGCIFTCSNGDFEWHERSIDGPAAVRCPDCNYEIIFTPSEYLMLMMKNNEMFVL